MRSWDPLQAFLLLYCDKTIENCSKRCVPFLYESHQVIVYIKKTRTSRKKEKAAMDRCNMTDVERRHYEGWVEKAAGCFAGIVTMGPEAHDQDLIPNDPHVYKEYGKHKIIFRCWLSKPIPFESDDFIVISRYPPQACTPARLRSNYKNMIAASDVIENYVNGTQPRRHLLCLLCSRLSQSCIMKARIGKKEARIWRFPTYSLTTPSSDFILPAEIKEGSFDILFPEYSSSIPSADFDFFPDEMPHSNDNPFNLKFVGEPSDFCLPCNSTTVHFPLYSPSTTAMDFELPEQLLK